MTPPLTENPHYGSYDPIEEETATYSYGHQQECAFDDDDIEPLDEDFAQGYDQRLESSAPQHEDDYLDHERGMSDDYYQPRGYVPAALYRGIFKRFGAFNAVQSACFDDIMHTNDNMVISAPTGSGKTVLFELAIIKMHMDGRGGKAVYIAPTKALCTEKFTDWCSKFEPLGLTCYELTGDTATAGRSLWSEARKASIIVTTAEKWDSVTRGWNDHQEMLSFIHLFLVDEVHVLGESRGSTLEVVVSRMKMRGSGIRFVLVSATIPNIDDIAAWISSNRITPAKVLEFGEEFRPCKLTRHVVGVPRNSNANSFMFAKSLNARLFEVIQTYSSGKPILIFDATRKGVFDTAELLVKNYKEEEGGKNSLPWARPPIVDALFRDKRLTAFELAAFAATGVGVHHAGLETEDRKLTEKLYRDKTLRVLVATSTLAVGVNLPAHLVIVKGVQLWQNGRSAEYSDLDIMQMLGRAGRPQYDTEGIAVIMCEMELVGKYQALTHGTKVLESCLHRGLSEHLNSEIGLGTIADLESAKHWLRGSFFYQRVRKNPRYYAMNEDDQDMSLGWQERLDNLVSSSVQDLRENQLVKEKADSATNALISTDYGEIMSRFYLRLSTMVEILSIPKNATLRDILEAMSKSEEFNENKLRHSEKSACNELRRHKVIRFEMKKVETTAEKVFVLIQAVLGGISLNAPEYSNSDCRLYMEMLCIFQHVSRLSRAIAEVGIVKKDARLVKHGLELVRCLNAKAWEDRPVVLRQIESLGDKGINILAERGITTLEKLRLQDPTRIELLLNRTAGFGEKLVAFANAMPRYSLMVKELEVHSDRGRSEVEVELAVTCGLLNPHQYGDKTIAPKKGFKMSYDRTSVLTMSSDNDFIDFRRIPTKVLREASKEFTITASLTKPSQSIVVIITSDTFAGCTVQREYRPKLAPSEFPVPHTKPVTSIELDLEGLEDDPDFWNMTIDSSDPVPKAHSTSPPKATGLKRKKENTKSANKSKPNDLVSVARQLPNGNYECSHTCHDKTQCRHFCCRNGVTDPTKKGKENSVKESSKPSSSLQRLHTLKKVGNIAVKNEKKLEELEKLHNSTSVSKNLALSSGQRIKLGAPSSPIAATGPAFKTKKKPKPAPNYDLSFADLGEANLLLNSEDYGSDIVLSDDEFPKAILTVDKAKTKKAAGAKLKVAAKPSPPPAKLKRTNSAISISSDSENEVPLSRQTHPPPVPKKKKLERTSSTLLEDVVEPALEGSDPPLFIQSENDGSTDDNTNPNSLTLADDIEQFFGWGTASDLPHSKPRDLGPARYSQQSAVQSNAAPTTNSLLLDDSDEEWVPPGELDDFADLDAWVK
ncbi:Sec63 Brl domain-containing protein [Ephemerocybe angulata]|uniref:DNA 3'-5' helicase n=1 Tax=Ephemerocybe angulata TaxID=980116 RepID=A0A8H6IEI6_9AGAR|nr:Sec63 Brl domain-containing protein [Tulosesus angulatus]